MSRAAAVESALRGLLDAIERGTDCMTNQVDRARLDPLVDHAFLVLSDLCDPEPVPFIDQPAAESELIEWHRVENLPDSDTTVLIIAGGDTEVWLGYLDGDQWRDADGFRIDNVIYWAHVPSGPVQ